MEKLPHEISMGRLLEKELPGDTTVGEARAFLMKGEAIAAIKRVASRPDAVRIRVLNLDGKEVRDDMLLREMQRLVKAGQVHLVIDDGEGGMKVKEHA